MVCGIFTLLGVILGVVLTLFSKGEIRVAKKQAAMVTEDGQDSGDAKSEQQLMKQWQNLLSYGGESESESYN